MEPSKSDHNKHLITLNLISTSSFHLSFVTFVANCQSWSNAIYKCLFILLQCYYYHYYLLIFGHILKSEMAISKCCCCFDLRKGVKILGKVSLFLTFTAAAISIAFKLKTGRGSYYGIIGAIPSIIVDLLLIHACNEKRRALLLPW